MQNAPRKGRNCRGRLWRSYCKCGQATTGAHCAPLQICFFSHYSRTANGRPYRITSHPLTRKSMFLWNTEGGVPYKVFPFESQTIHGQIISHIQCKPSSALKLIALQEVSERSKRIVKCAASQRSHVPSVLRTSPCTTGSHSLSGYLTNGVRIDIIIV